MPAPLPIFEYTDYRLLLRDFYRQKKAANPQWSYNVWARHLGLKSHSMLVMILKGQRNPSPELIRGLAVSMGLAPKESDYLSDLVELVRAKDDVRLTVLLMEKIAQRYRKQRFRYLDFESFRAISDWYYYAIREMVNLKSFDESPHWICRQLRFRVSPPDVTRALNTMLKLGLLVRDSKGRLQPGVGTIDTTSDIADEGIQRFHEQSLEHAKQSLRTVNVDKREFYSATLAMPTENIPRAKELIRKFTVEFMELMEAKESDSVFQMQVALFPLTRLIGAPK